MMPPLIAAQQLGYLWLTFGGDKACEDCRSRDGQEYHFDPQPGQQPAQGMRKPPLHPYCGCTCLPLMGVTVDAAQEGQGGRRSYIHGGFKAGGGWWRANGRGLFDGPIRTKWCGENWSAGKDTRDPDAVGPEDPTPEDDMDGVCKDHDDCYDVSHKDECDRMIVNKMEALPADPRQWKTPPPEGEIRDANDFKKLVIWYFKRQINKRQVVSQMDYEE